MAREAIATQQDVISVYDVVNPYANPQNTAAANSTAIKATGDAAVTAGVTTPEQEAAQKKKRIIIISCIAGGVIIIGITAWLILRKK